MLKLLKISQPMIKLMVADLCKMRNILHPLPVLVKAGITRSVAHDYIRGKRVFVHLKHIEILCRLLNCTPNELLAWEPDSPADDLPQNPLQKIRKRDLTETIKILNGKTIEEIYAWSLGEKKQNAEV